LSVYFRLGGSCFSPDCAESSNVKGCPNGVGARLLFGFLYVRDCSYIVQVSGELSCIGNFLRCFGKLKKDDSAADYFCETGDLRGLPRKPRTTVPITVGLLLPNPRNNTEDDIIVALVK
jgi:hypothetical protein